jgi:outer membrane protein
MQGRVNDGPKPESAKAAESRRVPFTRLIAGAMTLCSPAAAEAQDLRTALQQTLDNSPRLAARRAALAAQSEDIVAARVEGRPTLRAVASFTENLRYQLPSVFNPDRRTGADAFATIPLYEGGRIRHAVRSAKRDYLAGQAELDYSISELLVEAVMAYGNVLRDVAIVEMAESNVADLEVNLRAAQGRFRIGDLTKTDVAQSEARLALARAAVSEARAVLARSRQDYVVIIGAPPDSLQDPTFAFEMPASERDAITVAIENNPALRAARHRISAASARISAARAERNPRVRATGAIRYFNYLDSITADLPFEPRKEGTAVELGLSMEVPLYQGGGPSSLVRRSIRERAGAVEEEIAVERTILGQVRTTFASFHHLLAEEEQARIALAASERALSGARLEHEFGTRTLLDVLDTRRELLETQVNLRSIQRDLFVARFLLAASMGKASPADLGLAAPRDSAVIGPKLPRNSWSDWADGPQRISVTGTRTVDLPEQGQR